MKNVNISLILICATLVSVNLFCKTTEAPDVTGNYIFNRCTDTATDSKVYRKDMANVVALKKMTRDTYLIEFIGGNASGTKMSGKLNDKILKVDFGEVTIDYIFTSGYKTVTITDKSIECLYDKIKKK